MKEIPGRRPLAKRGDNLSIFQLPKDTNIAECITRQSPSYRLYITKEFWVEHKSRPWWLIRLLQKILLGMVWEKIDVC